ncbi:MAG: bifunctional precorrin-2 dehydrogenase/sirohydrochlorin ferrochelatase [Methanobacteriaceae archaeon]|jgi:precorrin-2 dehydrogenase/sirohydrochlorin ferrochelatase|nr:bifunctional precorrin-2 dehydrogenase/sirohydrochlorin ferrochelatase [Methanobacteriaceae archaeon]MDO9627030.1 bifunctional precorrin-2 dehydrogenase/sirohydrochlorin ferrochelatase [Methanobacteriaceae archaeon]
MTWTPLFLKTDKMKVLVLGAGEVGERRASRFIQAGAEVIVTGGKISDNLQKLGAMTKPINEIEILVEWADLVVLASGDSEMNNKVASLAGEKLLNRADAPLEGNVIVPTTFSIADAQISIFTGGKSPLMARMLRKKIQSIITPEDILKIELQDYSRTKLKECVVNQKLRRDYLYQISNNPEINKCLKENNLEEAIDNVNSFISQLDDSDLKINNHGNSSENPDELYKSQNSKNQNSNKKGPMNQKSKNIGEDSF